MNIKKYECKFRERERERERASVIPMLFMLLMKDLLFDHFYHFKREIFCFVEYTFATFLEFLNSLFAFPVILLFHLPPKNILQELVAELYVSGEDSEFRRALTEYLVALHDEWYQR